VCRVRVAVTVCRIVLQCVVCVWLLHRGAVCCNEVCVWRIVVSTAATVVSKLIDNVYVCICVFVYFGDFVCACAFV